MIGDELKEIRIAISERLTGPLFGAFAISFCAWNFRAILVVLSSEPVLTKFRIIDQVIYGSTWNTWLHCLLLPLLAALAYIFVYPYPARIIFRWYQENQTRMLRIRQLAEGQQLLSFEESAKIRAKIVETKQQAAKEQQEHSSEVAQLESVITDLRSRLTAAQAQIETFTQHEQEQGKGAILERPQIVEIDGVVPPREEVAAADPASGKRKPLQQRFAIDGDLRLTQTEAQILAVIASLNGDDRLAYPHDVLKHFANEAEAILQVQVLTRRRLIADGGEGVGLHLTADGQRALDLFSM